MKLAQLFRFLDGLKYMFDIKHKLLLHLRQEEILPSRKIKNMFKKVNVLKPLVSHPIVNEVYKILESFPKRKKRSMNNHSKRNNRSENSNVASLETDSETQPIDGNISNYKSDGPFQNDKMEPHGKITTSVSSQVSKLVTDLQASEGFPMELLSNQTFNIECQGNICYKHFKTLTFLQYTFYGNKIGVVLYYTYNGGSICRIPIRMC